MLRVYLAGISASLRDIRTSLRYGWWIPRRVGVL